MVFTWSHCAASYAQIYWPLATCAGTDEGVIYWCKNIENVFIFTPSYYYGETFETSKSQWHFSNLPNRSKDLILEYMKQWSRV